MNMPSTALRAAADALIEAANAAADALIEAADAARTAENEEYCFQNTAALWQWCIDDAAALAGDAPGRSGQAWQETAENLAANLHSLADLYAAAAGGRCRRKTVPISFPSPSELKLS